MDYQYLKHSGIIHMNGRVYDPKLGRMLSPDPVTQAPENGQNYNRYSYANNNPLKYTDPSGYAFDPVTGYVAATVANSVILALGNAIFGVGNKCDADCQWRNQANAWCSSTAACVDTKNQSRRTRDNKDFKNGNNAGLNIPYAQYTAFQAAQAGDSTSNGTVVVNDEIVGRKAFRLAIGILKANGELNSRRTFKTADAAAMEVLNLLAPLSKRYGLEVGGNIKWSKSGWYYTSPKIGGPNSVGVDKSYRGYHTHPSGPLTFSNFNTALVGPGDAAWVSGAGKDMYLGVERGDGRISIGVCSPGSCKGFGIKGSEPSRVLQ